MSWYYFHFCFFSYSFLEYLKKILLILSKVGCPNYLQRQVSCLHQRCSHIAKTVHYLEFNKLLLSKTAFTTEYYERKSTFQPFLINIPFCVELRFGVEKMSLINPQSISSLYCAKIGVSSGGSSFKFLPFGVKLSARPLEYPSEINTYGYCGIIQRFN